jgi:hypothetical protein
MDMRVVDGGEPQIHTFINGETCYQTMLMIHMSAQRTNSIWRKNKMLKIFHA